MKNSEPITIVVSRRIKKDTEEQFGRLCEELTSVASSFEAYLGAVMICPTNENDPEYRMIYKFGNPEDLDKWVDSKIRASILKKIEPLMDGPSIATKYSGILTWLTLSGKATGAPKNYKITIVSWLALYPLVTLIFFLFGDILANMPLMIRTFIVTAMGMLIMSYVLMPQFTKWFSFWLFPKEKEKIR